MQFLGLDIGSSSVKVSVVDEKGTVVTSAQYPEVEMAINAPHAGWAEQDPESWWEAIKKAVEKLQQDDQYDAKAIQAIGITYQMHGLVIVDKDQQPLRPSIIWCDSRAVEVGNQAFEELGADFCLNKFLNSPGNFTASKLKWVKDNEPAVFAQVDKFMLPGDYIAMKLTGIIGTSITGLSEGILWNFEEDRLNTELLDHYGIPMSMVPAHKETFTDHGKVTEAAAAELGIPVGIPITYKAGDQPNNAFSLNVVEPGEIAATAGTSGVVYGVTDSSNCDPLSRVNPFAHVNHTLEQARLGVLLCINGTGIANSWLQKNIAGGMGYAEMNEAAAAAPIGANGIAYLPFGNGAERVLNNQNIGAAYVGLDFNRHNQKDLIRATQEGIVFAFQYGIEVMKEMGMAPKVIKAGKANMFLSPIFIQTLANVTGVAIELYDTDGARGAAIGGAVGAKHFGSFKEAFAELKILDTVAPVEADVASTQAAYQVWKEQLEKVINKEMATV